MNARQIVAMARKGRPDLAAQNLGASGCGAWTRQVRLLRVIQRYPHISGTRFSMAYLGACWRQGRAGD